MRRLLAALAVLPFLAIPAHASSTSEGDCNFDTINVVAVSGEDEYQGQAGAVVVLRGGGHDNVVNATVTCEIEVNNVVVASASRWGSGVVAFVAPVTYHSADTDNVELCTTVDYTSDDSPTIRWCGQTAYAQIPPQDVINLFDYVVDVLTYAEYGGDPVVCTAFPLVLPGSGPVSIGPDGDVYLDGELFWDCPPYRTPVPPGPPGPPPMPGTEPLTGAGYDTGDAGALLLMSDDGKVHSSCGFVKAGDTIVVAGLTHAAGASGSSVRCRLTDEAGAVLYDSTATSGTAVAVLSATVAAPAGPVTVCTAGPGIALACRRGEPLH